MSVTIRSFCICLVTCALWACGDDDASNDAAVDDDASSSGDAAFNMDAGDAGAAACFINATTHFEIINACTDAEAIDKVSVLPNLLTDGGLPAIP